LLLPTAANAVATAGAYLPNACTPTVTTTTKQSHELHLL
jgi:hypothetical protein